MEKFRNIILVVILILNITVLIFVILQPIRKTPVEEKLIYYLEHQNDNIKHKIDSLEHEKKDTINAILHSSDSDALGLWYQLVK